MSRKFSKVFYDRNKLIEMLQQRQDDYSLPDLARQYGVDHTSIHYQCKKFGVKPYGNKNIRQMIQKFFVNDEIPEPTHSSPVVIEKINKGHSYKQYLAEEKLRKQKHVAENR